jgi:hypothetical protein
MATTPFAQIHPDLWRVLQTPPETLVNYRLRVAKLCDGIARDFAVQLRSRGSDYSSDWIELWISKSGAVVPTPSIGSVYCKLFVCTRGPIATLSCKVADADGIWTPVSSLEGFSNPFQAALKQLTHFLQSAGYTVLSGEVLHELVDGQTTSLDGLPANVFQVFFSELE